MARRTQWSIAIRCYQCQRKFTLRHLELDNVFSSPLVTFCPYCCTQLHIGSGPADRDQTYLHRVDLREETESIYRKAPDSNIWHFAEDCSRWPIDDYLQLEMQPDIGELCSECKAKLLRIKVH
ncbi:MAG TPA: hypothetical protein VL754_10880 [Verrucomicrobiae bacterium]|jgi:hypothetical protein|nr:hypothetical protein [Verrucomicrobiae bacterium]